MAILEVCELYKNFGKTEVLKGVSFSMHEGEVLSVIGSSGSGKTTLLRCINALETPTAGQIIIDGETVYDHLINKKLSAEEKRRWQLNCGLVFQSFNLFPQYSVMDNVTLAPKLLAKKREDYKARKAEIIAEIEENAYQTLKRVGLEEKTKSYPCELSGGQQQRVAIARALVLRPKVLFFDEPTSALDPELTNEVLRVIRELADMKTTMVIVTHEMRFARDVSDRVVFMDDGNIVAAGKPSEIFSQDAENERLRAFLGSFEQN